MAADAVWNSLEAAKLVAEVLTPIAVVIVAYFINQKINEAELANQKQLEIQRQKYEDKKEQERFEREERINEIKRLYTPHIDIRVDCKFFGPREDKFLVNILLFANNRGQVRHYFKNINLRIRGIKDESFQEWARREPRAFFPHKILDTELVPPDWNFIYVEPGVSHQITYPTIIDADYSYILVFAEFKYREPDYLPKHFTYDVKNWPHNVEMIFAVPKKSD